MANSLRWIVFVNSMDNHFCKMFVWTFSLFFFKSIFTLFSSSFCSMFFFLDQHLANTKQNKAKQKKFSATATFLLLRSLLFFNFFAKKDCLVAKKRKSQDVRISPISGITEKRRTLLAEWNRKNEKLLFWIEFQLKRNST